MAFLKHNGRTVGYRLLGDSAKPLLMLAHPLGMTQAVWDDMLPALLNSFRVLTWDLPGHGASAAWPEASDQIAPEDLHRRPSHSPLPPRHSVSTSRARPSGA